jgi:cytochrome c553
MSEVINSWNRLPASQFIARQAGRLCYVCLFVLLLLPTTLFAAEPDFDTMAYVQTYCIRCHNAEEQNADRRFDNLATELSDKETAEHWQEILDVVNLGEMPPEDEPQPSGDDTKRFVATVTHQLARARESLESGGHQRFRRLNRYEYRNTIRDLLGVNMDSFDPTTSFPADDRVDGFENLGEHLVLSDYLLQCYLEAASQSIEKAVQAGAVVEPIAEVLRPDDMSRRRYYFRPEQQFIVNPTGDYVDVAHTDTDRQRLAAGRFKGVPADGYYTIRIQAEGINREHPYSSSLLQVDRDEPIKMQLIVTDPQVARPAASQNSSDRIVATVPLPDHQSRVYEFRVWMDKGFVPVIRYANGPLDFRSSMIKVLKKYHPETLTSNWRDVFSTEPSEILDVWMSDAYEGPRMRIHQMEIAGPEAKDNSAADSWDRLPACHPRNDRLEAYPTSQALEQFLYRAFRRPPLESEVNRYQAFFQARLAIGESKKTAFLTACKAILCSPNFLYVETPPDADAKDESAFRLASRLSYFLWSSMPDDELLDVAASGTLGTPETMAAQMRRMLKDPRAEAFNENFTNSWLHLNQLGSMPPDTQKFATYYDRRLEPLMRRETQLFFAEILQQNLSIENFIDSDFTFANRYLAAHYGLPTIEGDDFRRISLPKQSLRGGLLGHASVLTTTSNGVESSPVTRGIWVLENILGSPPPPPPPDVEPLEPDIRGATTIREQLAKHRDVATCAECHRKIDPIGFALESFDPIGSLRREYRDSKGKTVAAVDTAGTLPTGESFADIAELKRLLLKQKDQFAHCLTEKMLTYALGREVGFQDRPTVESITAELAERGDGLQDLVELVVTSDVFLDD